MQSPWAIPNDPRRWQPGYVSRPWSSTLTENWRGLERQLRTDDYQRLPCGCPIDSACDGYHALGA